MNIILYLNSKIDKKNVVRAQMDQYLLSLEQKKISNVNIQQLNIYSFDIVLSLKDEWIYENLNKIDFCEISDFIFSKLNRTFFNVEKIEFLSNQQIKIQFILNETQTWLIDLSIDSNQKISIERSHINYRNQFLDDNLTLKRDSILNLEQPTGQFTFIKEEYNSALNNPEAIKMNEAIGVQKWIIVFLNSEIFSSDESNPNDLIHITKSKKKERSVIEQFNKSYASIVCPLSSFETLIKVFDYLGIFMFEIEGGKALYDLTKIQTDQDVPFISLLDNFPISKYLKWNSNLGGLQIIENGAVDWLYIEKDGLKKYYGFRPSNFYANNDGININNDLIFDLSEDEKSKIEYVQNIKLDTEIWEYSDEQILNFFPFKKMEIGSKNEKWGSGLIFDQSYLKKIVNNNKIGNYYYSFSPFSYTINISLNSIKENNEATISRGLALNKSVDEWIQYKQNSTLNGKGDFLVPIFEAIAGATLTAFTGGISTAAGAALLINSGVKATETFLNHKTIQNKSGDSASSSATDLENEILKGYDFTCLKILKPSISELISSAFEFHKKGLFQFNLYLFPSDFINKKLRFNFLKISTFETEKIWSDYVPYIYKKSLLKNYISGVWNWNYNIEHPDLIFDFKYANPDNQ